jgi:GT2 family glycosyltransferase
MNQGLALAREEYVVFLNAGDTFLDAMSLEYVSDALLESNPEWAAFGGYIRGQSGDLIRRPRPMSGVHEVAYGSAKFLHPSIYYKRTLLEELHGYNESFKIAGDLDLNIRSALCSSPLIVETPVSVFYADGISSKRIFLSIRESRRARRLNLDFTPKSSILDFVWFCYQNLRSGIAKLLTATED